MAYSSKAVVKITAGQGSTISSISNPLILGICISRKIRSGLCCPIALTPSKPNSVVQISAGKEDNNFWISVKDEGPGFSEKDRNQLFQRFKKLSARPTAGETSNGLGLAIVKTLVDRLNGTIDLVSEPDKGSEFIVKLPLIPVAQEVQV